MEVYVSEIVPPAVMLLLKHGISLVEYGQSTMRQYGYPQVALKLEYVVSDDELELASNLLGKNGFYSIPSDPHLQEIYGDLETKGRYYSGSPNNMANVVPIQLFASSLVHVSFDKLEQKPSFEQSDRAVYALSLPQHCISLIRTIVDYPLRSASRTKPLIELTALIAYGIFGYQYYEKDWERPEESDEEYHRNVRFALEKVRSWKLSEDADHERRLLESLIDGSLHEGDIPYKGSICLPNT